LNDHDPAKIREKHGFVNSWIYVVDAENSCAVCSPAASPASLPSAASDPIVNTLQIKGLAIVTARGVHIQNVEHLNLAKKVKNYFSREHAPSFLTSIVMPFLELASFC